MSDDKIHAHIDAAKKRAELPEYSQDAPCPTCGGVTETGFGLAGGGFGIYCFCQKCGVVTSKSETPD